MTDSGGSHHDDVVSTDDPSESSGGSHSGRRTVETPPSLVKVVVIFSTLIAIATVLAGFLLLDAATRVVENPTASVFVGLVRAVTGLSTGDVEPYLTPIALAVGVAGLAAIGVGAWVYAMGTRFRTSDGNA